MAGFIKKTGGGKNIKEMVSHLKYVGFRSREKPEESKGFFDEKKDTGVDYKKFIKEIANNPALKHPLTNKYHKFVFSLSRREYENSNRDLKDIIRDTLKRYEKNHKVKLNWIGSLHDSKDHPHGHIIISGATKNEIDGKYERVKFYKDDFKELRQSFQMEVDRDRSVDLEAEKENFFKRQKNINTASQFFEQVIFKIRQDIEHENQQREREREK